MKKEYNFSDLPKKKNPYPDRINKDTPVIITYPNGKTVTLRLEDVSNQGIIALDPDLEGDFKSSEEVNKILRWVKENHPDVLHQL